MVNSRKNEMLRPIGIVILNEPRNSIHRFSKDRIIAKQIIVLFEAMFNNHVKLYKTASILSSNSFHGTL